MIPPIYRQIWLIAALFATTASAQPLEDFEKIVAKCKGSFSGPFSEVSFLASTGKWVKRTTWPTGVQYDVKKTDSLVSPFTGYIAVNALVAGSRADSEEAAKALDISQEGPLSKRETRISFAYQSGIWQAIDATEKTAIRLKPGDQYQTPVSVRVSKDDLLRPFSATERCLRAQ